MVLRTIRAEDIPADLKARQFLQSLDLSREELVFEDNGEARIVLLSAKTLEQRRQAREQLFALIDRIQSRHPNGDSDAVLRELEEIDADESRAS